MIRPSVALWVLSAATWVVGNTEIVNFEIQDSSAVFLPSTEKWPAITPEVPTVTMSVISAAPGTVPPQDICRDPSSGDVVHCPHEEWLMLDLDAENWKGFQKFTLRLSWPAFHPTDIDMKIYKPSDLLIASNGQPIQGKTRRKYARIQFAHSGVLTPTQHQINDTSRYHLPFIITLEPLHFGIIPSSIIPVLVAILLVIILGIPLSFQIDFYLRLFVQRVQEDERQLTKHD